MLNEFGTINSNWVQQQQQMKMDQKKTHLTIFGRCLLLRFDLRFSFIHHKTSPIIESIRFFFWHFAYKCEIFSFDRNGFAFLNLDHLKHFVSQSSIQATEMAQISVRFHSNGGFNDSKDYYLESLLRIMKVAGGFS